MGRGFSFSIAVGRKANIDYDEWATAFSALGVLGIRVRIRVRLCLFAIDSIEKTALV